jgi:hypothetical protein
MSETTGTQAGLRVKQHIGVVAEEPGFLWFEVREGDRWITSIELREEGIWVRRQEPTADLAALPVCGPEVAPEVAALIADFYGRTDA